MQDVEISKKKPFFKINNKLKDYLGRYGRHISLPLQYADLLKSHEQFPLIDESGEDTLWQIMLYPSSEMEYLHKALTHIYAILKMNGDLSFVHNLYIERIDFCTFGNSKPFRIKIVNQFNDNYDYFYVKTADSNRVYGLELEDLLSPNRLNYIVDSESETLIEEHVVGIPGDIFLEEFLDRPNINKVRVCKEFVKFNERCFVRLLGDMRSYNYVVDITPDFDNEQYRVRTIDFDQQFYEGKVKTYLPQFFKENYNIVKFVVQTVGREALRQYQLEERVLMSKRYHSSKLQIDDLLSCVKSNSTSTAEKLNQLKEELNQYHVTDVFSNCENMGEVLSKQMKLLLDEK